MITTISNQLMLMGPQNSKEEKAENWALLLKSQKKWMPLRKGCSEWNANILQEKKHHQVASAIKKLKNSLKKNILKNK
jgi:hypothetical protein